MSTSKRSTKRTGEPESKSITVKNAGPVKEFTLVMNEGPGFYRLSGENGQGKSFFQRAWLRATGHDVSVALRDGAKELTVDFNGENLLNLKKVKPNGDVEGELWSDCPLADFILPDASDPAVNERRRIEAVVRMVDTQVNDDTIRTLLEGYVVDEDNEELSEAIEQCVDNAFDFVMENEGETIRNQNIVVAKERVRRRVHEMKRTMEQRGEAAQAEITARTMPKPEVVVEIPVAKALEVYETRVGDLREKQGSAKQRAEREREREEIRRTLGERPDPSIVEKEINGLLGEQDSVQHACGDLREQIASLQATLAAKEHELSRVRRHLSDARERFIGQNKLDERWQENRRILDSEITGATSQDVEQAQYDVIAARTVLEQAQATERWQESCRLVREAQETRETAFARAAIYDKIATSTTGQLAVLLAQAGVEGLTVDEDRLCEIQPGGVLEPISRLSEGERARIGCKILLKNQAVPYNVLVLPGRLVRSLGPKAYAEVEEELIKAGLYAVYEQPGEGEELSAEKA